MGIGAGELAHRWSSATLSEPGISHFLGSGRSSDIAHGHVRAPLASTPFEARELPVAIPGPPCGGPGGERTSSRAARPTTPSHRVTHRYPAWTCRVDARTPLWLAKWCLDGRASDQPLQRTAHHQEMEAGATTEDGGGVPPPHAKPSVPITASEWACDAGHHFALACRRGQEMIAKAHRPVVCLRDLRRQQAPFVVKGLRGGGEGSGASSVREAVGSAQTPRDCPEACRLPALPEIRDIPRALPFGRSAREEAGEEKATRDRRRSRSRAGPRNRSGQSRGPGVVPMPTRSTSAATNNHEVLAGGMRGKGVRALQQLKGPSAPKFLRRVFSQGWSRVCLVCLGSTSTTVRTVSVWDMCPPSIARQTSNDATTPLLCNTTASQPRINLDRRLEPGSGSTGQQPAPPAAGQAVIDARECNVTACE